MPESIEILFEDADLLVVNKPAGILSIPDRQGRNRPQESITRLITREQPLRLVHRLDRQTSGVLILTKNIESQRSLTDQFFHRRVEKTYLALVRGHADVESGLIYAPLAQHPTRPNQMIIADKGGKAAQTEWRIIERWGNIALVRCRPFTGRQHQIRVHLAYAQLPLLVDEIYSGSSAFYLSEVKSGYHPSKRHEERPLIGRLTLHAESITFAHPRHNNRMKIEAPLPKDFQVTLNQLRKLQ